MVEIKNSISRESILFAIIGLLLGLVIAVLFAKSAVNNNNIDMMRMMGMRQNEMMSDEKQEMMEEVMHGDSMSMQEMLEDLKGKTGDNFDEAFISLMIEHHQGAIDMANLAKVNAKHPEIKNLAEDIISAQTKEIEMMREWQSTWGY